MSVVTPQRRGVLRMFAGAALAMAAAFAGAAELIAHCRLVVLANAVPVWLLAHFAHRSCIRE